MHQFHSRILFYIKRNIFNIIISNHKQAKEKAMKEHETKLGQLETYAMNSAIEIQDKMQLIEKSILEQKTILVRSQALANRYK